MKRSFWIAAFGFLSLNLFAQGTVQFQNLLVEGGTFVMNDSVLSAVNPGLTQVIFLKPVPSGIFPNPGNSGAPSYITGGGSLTPTAPSGSAADFRNRGFSGSGYFTSSSEGVDSGFNINLGNGVNPVKAASFGGVTIVPEPSIFALAGLGLTALLLGRKRFA